MGTLPLEGLKVVDISVLFASPTISQNMGDFGAEVIKVEHPRLGDSLRSLGAAKDGIPLWWKITNRNKKCVTLDLNKPEGQEILKQLVADADVLTENFGLVRWSAGDSAGMSCMRSTPGSLWRGCLALGRQGRIKISQALAPWPRR